ncbi:MAG: cobyrinate a,c-diamide synthase [Tissierellaceae bacterium]|nr:cobyrinate a,c-diamide synthase [Tissierellaceae bacterium]
MNKSADYKASKTNRLMIAGTGSGCGKTTMISAVMKGLLNQGLKVNSFKSGPDYIDPMFHSKITGTKSRNLDMFLCGENTVKQLFTENSKDCDISIIEGVMGFYDGLGMDTIDYSSNDLSNKTSTPVVLVVNAKGMAISVLALIKGFLEFKDNLIKGVLLNGVNPMMYPKYKEIIEKSFSIKVLGFLPNLPEIAIESRHLGLITADEINDLHKKVDILGKNAAKYIDLDGLVEIASSVPELEYENLNIEKIGDTRVAIAKDNAFCFYYEDNLELLRRLGAELIPFSPLDDKSLPMDIHGIIIGGGYPELYTEALSNNKSMLNSIRNAYDKGIPIYAESGGFIYLGSTIEEHSMVNIFNFNSELTNKLQNFGYIKLVANKDNILCKKGDSVNAHEFHYTKSNFDGDDFTAIKKSTGKERNCIIAGENIFAGFPHIHLWGNIEFAKGFIQKCIKYSTEITSE